MRQRFVLDPDRTKPRPERPARVKRILLVLALALTGAAGIHSLYTQDNAAADGSRIGDQPNAAPQALAQVLPDAAADPVAMMITSGNSLHAPTADAGQAPGASIPAQSGAVPPAQSRIAETPEPAPSEQASGNGAEKSHSPKHKVARHRSNREAGASAAYPYRDFRAWAWNSQRPSPSPFFHF
jgi:hypothetical protein